MSRKRTLRATISRAKKLRNYVPFASANLEPEPELIDMSVWRIGGTRGFRTDFGTRNSEDCQNSETDEMVDRDWVLVSRDELVVPDDWEEVLNNDCEPLAEVARSLGLGGHDREDEDLSNDDLSVDIFSGESGDVPCVVPSVAALCHSRSESNPFPMQQGQNARERSCNRQRRGGEE